MQERIKEWRRKIEVKAKKTATKEEERKRNEKL